MTRVLSLAVAAVLVTSSFAQFNPFFRRADDSEVIDPADCRGEGWENDLVARFVGIFFGDFYTGGSQDILGPLAVKGNFHAPNYIVNANHGTVCDQTDSFNSYGLVVGGITDTFNTHVHGSSYLNIAGGTIEEIKQLDKGCYVTEQEGTGLFNFEEVEDLMLTTSKEFAGFDPTVILEDNNSLTELREEMANYEILTFHTCSANKCSGDRDTESAPNKIFFAEPNWNGVEGSVQVDKSKTYIMNVPVTNGATFEFNTNNPALGFDPCKLIWHFYPVDASGNYLEGGEFTLIRRTQNQLGGFTLAPRGHIVDGSVGNFAGNIVGLDYTWENLKAGVEIHDYGSAGGNCDQYLGCLPVHETSSLSMTKSTSINTSTTTKSRTKTWSTTETYESVTEKSEPVTFDPSDIPEESTSSSTSSSDGSSRTHGPITITTSEDCGVTDYTTTTTIDTTSSVLTVTVTTRSRTTNFVTSTTTESVETSHTTVDGLTETETETQTETEVSTETMTNAAVETVTVSGTDLTILTTDTITVAIVTESETTICTDTTDTLYSDCGIVEVCSSATAECEVEEEGGFADEEGGSANEEGGFADEEH